MGHHHPQPRQVEGNDAFNAQQREQATRKVTIVGAITNTLLAIIQLIGGWFTQSQALIADGFHTLSDLVSDVVVLIANRYAHKEADDNHPYGHGRIETLATVILGLMLAGVAVGIFIRSWERLFGAEPLSAPATIAMLFAALAILAKEGLYHYTLRAAKQVNSSLLKANAWHHRSDAISSIVVLVGIGGAQLGFPWLDPLAAMLVAVMILYMAGQFILESTSELVDTGLDPEETQKLRQFISELEGVENIHLLRTRRMGGHILVDVHLQVDSRLSVSEGHFIGDQAMCKMRHTFPTIRDVIVHIDPEDDEQPINKQALLTRAELLQRLQAIPQANSLWPYIENCNLHYINGKVRIELILMQDAPQEALADFKHACNTVDCIEGVRFMLLIAP